MRRIAFSTRPLKPLVVMMRGPWPSVPGMKLCTWIGVPGFTDGLMAGNTPAFMIRARPVEALVGPLGVPGLVPSSPGVGVLPKAVPGRSTGNGAVAVTAQAGSRLAAARFADCWAWARSAPVTQTWSLGQASRQT